MKFAISCEKILLPVKVHLRSPDLLPIARSYTSFYRHRKVNFSEDQNFSTTDISQLFVGARRNLAVLVVWLIKTYYPNFVNFGPGVP